MYIVLYCPLWWRVGSSLFEIVASKQNHNVSRFILRSTFLKGLWLRGCHNFPLLISYQDGN